MMRIFAKLAVHQQEFPLLLLSSLVWTCRRSIAVSWPLNLRQVASLIRSNSLPWSGSCQVSSPLFHRQSPCPPLPPRISLSFLLVRIRQAELWFTPKHVHTQTCRSACRTLVHTQTCDRKVCKCRRRLATGSVDSLIGTLCAIYNKLGRFGHVNPVSHSLTKEYLKGIRVWRSFRGRQSLCSLRGLSHSSVTLGKKLQQVRRFPLLANISLLGMPLSLL